MEFDFSGYATKNNLRCSDGRVIRQDAFIDNDGQVVPLVWQHIHNDPSNVLGKALLENRPDGVYAYCKLNNTKKGRDTKELILHGDVDSMSIFATRLTQDGANVLHGDIKEVSLVLSGANPEALIDTVTIAHADGTYTNVEDEAVIQFNQPLTLSHSAYDDDDYDDYDEDGLGDYVDEDELVPGELYFDEETGEYFTVDDDDDDYDDYDDDYDDYDLQHDDLEDYDDEEDYYDDDVLTVGEIFDNMSDAEREAVYAIVDEAIAQEYEEGMMEHSGMYGGYGMKYNVFDGGDYYYGPEAYLSHDQLSEIMEDAQKCGSLKESFLAHAQSYGIEDIDILFPDARNVTPTPDFIKRDMEWVSVILDGTHHSPFSRIKSTAADITADEARARGYVKGNKKKEEVIKLLKRVTTPTTIYKKQKLDRDDIIDVTTLDVVSWLKAEMRMMLNEEIARAILVSDGREVTDEDKINEEHIRPIWKEDDMYAHHIVLKENYTPVDFIETIIRSRKLYKGTGRPTLFLTTDTLVDMLLLKDELGRYIYNTEAELISKLRVERIVEVPVMANQQRVDDDTNETRELVAIYVNLKDYTVGADKGGEVSMFDDFDIDFNQYKYLMETRMCGCLIHPKSALIFEKKVTKTPTKPSTPSGGDDTPSGGDGGDD